MILPVDSEASGH